MILIKYVNGKQDKIYQNVDPTSIWLQNPTRNRLNHMLSFDLIENEKVKIHINFKVYETVSFQLMPDSMLKNFNNNTM